ncbi:MAG TPA: hypothetical protein VLI06_00975 [Solimonas sp.]|nr:hypothetical protein [Solimonas sp.]
MKRYSLPALAVIGGVALAVTLGGQDGAGRAQEPGSSTAADNHLAPAASCPDCGALPFPGMVTGGAAAPWGSTPAPIIRTILHSSNPSQSRVIMEGADGHSQAYRLHDQLPGNLGQIVAIRSDGIDLLSGGEIRPLGIRRDVDTASAEDDSIADSSRPGDSQTDIYESCGYLGNDSAASACVDTIDDRIDELAQLCEGYANERRWQACMEGANRLEAPRLPPVDNGRS